MASKSSSKMKRTPSARRSPATVDLSLSDPDQIAVYARLSMVLNAFHSTALWYFSTGKEAAGRQKHAQEIEDRVIAFQRFAMGDTDMLVCAEGKKPCRGVCIDANDACIAPGGQRPPRE
jgi:hypothetical protein